jgi:Fe2+ transport system protein FeoA
VVFDFFSVQFPNLGLNVGAALLASLVCRVGWQPKRVRLKMNTRLTDALEGARVRVKKIGQDPEIRYKLGEIGIKHGEILKVLKEQTQQWFWSGIFRIKINDKLGVLEQRLSELIVVEKNGNKVRLLDLRQGEMAKVIAVEGELEEKALLREMGIRAGASVEIIGQFPHNILVFEIEGEEKKLSQNLATKIWVTLKGKKVQSNYLPQHVLSKILKIVGNEQTVTALANLGFVKGQFVKLKRHEEIPHDLGFHTDALFVELHGSPVRLGLELAGQVWVETLSQ